MVHIVENTLDTTPDGLIFGCKIPRQRLRMWPGIGIIPFLQCHWIALRSLTSSGNRAYRALAARQNPPKWFPNKVHRRLFEHNQARNVSRRLDRLKWTAAYVRNTISHSFIRHGGAANTTLALTSARAPRCLLCFSVSHALMVCDTLKVVDSNDIFHVPM